MSGNNKEYMQNDLVSLVTSGYSIINMADAYVTDELFIGNNLTIDTNTTSNNILSNNLKINGTSYFNNKITIGGHLLSDNIYDLSILNNKWKNSYTAQVVLDDTIFIETTGSLSISGGAIINGGMLLNNSIKTYNSCTIGNLVISSAGITTGTTLSGTLKTAGLIKKNNKQLNSKTNYIITGGAGFSMILAYNNIKSRILGAGLNAGALWGLPGNVGRGISRFINVPLTFALKDTLLTSLDISWAYVAAIDINGKLYTWGSSYDNTSAGMSGTGITTGNHTRPIDITSITSSSLYNKKIVQTAMGSFFLGMALDSSGQVHTWGENSAGQIGLGYTSGPVYVPVNISSNGSLNGKKIVKIANGDSFGCALDIDGQLHMWGSTNESQEKLNIGRSGGNLLPMIVSTSGSLNGCFIKDIESNSLCTLCIDSQNRLHGFGQFITKLATIRTGSLANKTPVKMANGRSGLYILDSDGEIHSVGFNYATALGFGLGGGTPGNISRLTGSSLIGKRVVAFGGGREQGLAIDSNGNVHSWGGTDINRGQLGDGGITTGSLVPQQVQANTKLDFTGQHRCYINGITEEDDIIGLIAVADTDSYYNDDITINEALPFVNISNKKCDKRVFGVIANKYNEEDINNLMNLEYSLINETQPLIPIYYINSVGEGGIWVCNENGNLESGDYICSSSISGYGMKQDDIILCNYTVAKSTMDCNFERELINVKRIQLNSGELDWVLDYKYYNYGSTSEYLEQMIPLEPPIERKVPIYRLKYINNLGKEITETEYIEQKQLNKSVFKAAFIGCTYHCG